MLIEKIGSMPLITPNSHAHILTRGTVHVNICKVQARS